jgi:bacterial/archaeal transporter family-2 protein
MALLVYLLGVIGGAASALQSAVNGRLGGLVGPLNAAVVSTTAALVSLLAYALLTRQLDLGQAAKSPAILLTGGIFGAIFVTSIIYVVPRLGVVTAVLLAILGQLIIAALADQFGLFGNPRVDLSPVRVIGIGLVLVGFMLARG